METVALLLKVLWAPKETLHFVSKRPMLVAPLIFITLFGVAEAAVLMLRVDSGQMRVEQWQREGIADKLSSEDQLALMTSARQQQRVALVSAAIRPLLIVLVVAAVFFGCFSVMGRTSGFRTFLAITAFCLIPLTVRSLLSIIMIMAVSPPTPHLLQIAGSVGPALFVNPTYNSNVTFVAAGLIDAVTFWVLALLVVGYGFVASPRVTTIHRIVVVVGVWILYAAFRLGLAVVANV